MVYFAGRGAWDIPLLGQLPLPLLKLCLQWHSQKINFHLWKFYTHRLAITSLITTPLLRIELGCPSNIIIWLAIHVHLHHACQCGWRMHTHVGVLCLLNEKLTSFQKPQKPPWLCHWFVHKYGKSKWLKLYVPWLPPHPLKKKSPGPVWTPGLYICTVWVVIS